MHVNVARLFPLIFWTLVTAYGCSRDQVDPSCASLPDSFVPSFLQELFLDLAFDQEFG